MRLVSRAFVGGIAVILASATATSGLPAKAGFGLLHERSLTTNHATPSLAVERSTWTPFKNKVPSRFLAKYVLRKHVLHVVEVRPEGKRNNTTPKAVRRAQVAEAIRLLQSSLPGMTVRVRYAGSVSAPADACTRPDVAWKAANQRVKESVYMQKVGQHMAALVDCNPRATFAFSQYFGVPGTGRIWAPWDADLVAHELGHTLGFFHSGSLDCSGPRPEPRSCLLDEYRDPVDIMGNLSGPTFTGLWRDMVFGAKDVPPGRPSAWTAEMPGEGARAEPLRIRTQFGTIYVELGPPNDFVSEPAVYVRLVVTRGEGPQQGLLKLPLMSGDQSDSPLPGLFAGDRFAIPGTDLVATIETIADGKARITFA